MIDSLTDDEKDVLMKYLYRGLEEARNSESTMISSRFLSGLELTFSEYFQAESCNQLLKWHGILTEKVRDSELLCSTVFILLKHECFPRMRGIMLRSIPLSSQQTKLELFQNLS